MLKIYDALIIALKFWRSHFPIFKATESDGSRQESFRYGILFKALKVTNSFME